MKIIIIANGYPSQRDAQWGCFEKDQALALSKVGHQVSVFYTDRRFRLYWRKLGITYFDENGISVYGMYLFPMGWLRDKVSYKIHQKVVMWMYRKLFQVYSKRKGKPDIIYAHYLWNISYVSDLKIKYGVPIVGIEHWSGMTQEALPPIAHYWASIGYHHADKLLAVSQSLYSHIYKHTGKKSIVVYDMLGQEFVLDKIEKKISGGAFKFIAVGSLIQRKGFDILIEAFSKSDLAKDRCSVTIIGEGPERKRLESQIADLGLEGRVCLVGRKTKNEIIEYMSHSHAFVLSSRAETFGVICIEALSQGLPNIATMCGGPEEFINKEDGILIEPENVEVMSKALREMYEHFSEYDPVCISEDCRRRFAPQVIATQLTGIFENVVKK